MTSCRHTQRGIPVSTLDKVSLDIQVVLGTTTMPVQQVLRLGRGAIIELEASEDDEVSILANNFPVAKGTVIVSGNRIAVEIKAMTPRLADARWAGRGWRCARRRALFLQDRFVTSGPSLDA